MSNTSKHQGLNSILKNASYLIGGQSINILSRAIYAIALARVLGPDVYGTFNYGLSWYLILLPATILGLDVLMSHEVGKDSKNGIEIISNTLSIRIIVTFLLTILSIGSVLIIETDPDVISLIVILSLALLGRSLFVWSKSVFTAIETAKHSFKLESILRPSEVIVGLIILLYGGGLIEIAITHTISWWIQGFLSLRVLKKLKPDIHIKFDAAIISHILKASIPLGLTSVFVTWFLQGPIIMFRTIEGFNSDLGQLTLIIQVFLMLSSIPTSIGSAALPILTRSLIRQDGKSNIFVEGMLRLIILTGGIIGIFLLAFGLPLVILVFGQDYATAGQLLGYMALILIPYSCSIIVARVSLAEGKYTSVAKATFYSALLFTICFYPAVYYFELTGAILSVGVGQILRLTLLIRTHIQLHLLDISTTIYRPMILIAISVLIIELMKQQNLYLALIFAVLVISAGIILLGIVRKSELKSLFEHFFKK